MRVFPYPDRGLLAAAVLACCSLAVADQSTPRVEQEPGDPFKPHTVWKGEIVYSRTDYAPESKPVPMILHVKRRKGARFEGTTWYPTQDNGLLLVTVRVDEKGAITLREEKVIHGKATARRNTGVLAGMKLTGQITNTTIKGSGEWTGPAFNGPIRVTFRLKLAG